MCPFNLGNIENKLEEFMVSLISQIYTQWAVMGCNCVIFMKSSNAFVYTSPHMFENLNQMADCLKNINQ